MKQNYQDIPITWKGIAILIRYNPNYSKAVLDIQGFKLVHIEVHCKDVLPITETGYKSIFTSELEVEQNGSAEQFIRKALNAQKTKEWEQQYLASKQGKLF